MKNTTMSRKASNTMRPGQGMTQPVARASQSGDGEDFAFNGQMGDGVNRAANRYAHNQWSGHSNDGRAVNVGSFAGARRGNTSDAPREGGPSVTRDPHRLTIATAAQGGRIDGGAHCEYPKNPDKINVG